MSRCLDCWRDTTPKDHQQPDLLGEVGWEYYMVHDKLWCAAGMEPDGKLCIVCRERRLGRELVPEDFTQVPVNEHHPWHSERLSQRQGHSA